MIRFDLSRRLLRVWQRNLLVYRKTWKISFVPPLTEPLLYLTAFGVGMRSVNTLPGNIQADVSPATNGGR